MSYLAQDQSNIQKAGIGFLNILIAVGAVVGFIIMSKKAKTKKIKTGYSKRKQAAKVRPIPR